MKTCFASLEEQESNKFGVSVEPSQTWSVVGNQDKDWHVGSGGEEELPADDNLGRKRTQNCEGNGEEVPGLKEEIAK